MKNLTLGLGAALLAAGAANAGAIDRSGQNITALFEEGNYVELTFSTVNPDVQGTGVFGPFTLTQSANSFTTKAFAYKHQFTENLSFALIADEPYGATVGYVDAPIAPGMAEVNSTALTGILRYEMDNGFSVHGGVRAQKLEGQIISTPGLLIAEGDYDLGGLVGVAYEIPEIALRVALTYFSSIDHSLDGTHNAAPTVATVTMPEAVNLDFQTGIAEDTLLFGSVRHVWWGGTSLDSTGAVNWVNFPSDSTSFNLGVGRRFTDKISASVSIGYEDGDATGDSFLSPTGTSKNVGLGVAYQATENVKISGGVRYVEFSDKTILAGPGTTLFSGGDAIAAGVKIGVSF